MWHSHWHHIIPAAAPPSDPTLVTLTALEVTLAALAVIFSLASIILALFALIGYRNIRKMILHSATEAMERVISQYPTADALQAQMGAIAREMFERAAPPSVPERGQASATIIGTSNLTAEANPTETTEESEAVSPPYPTDKEAKQNGVPDDK